MISNIVSNTKMVQSSIYQNVTVSRIQSMKIKIKIGDLQNRHLYALSFCLKNTIIPCLSIADTIAMQPWTIRALRWARAPSIPLDTSQISLCLVCWLIDKQQILTCDFVDKNWLLSHQANLVIMTSI